MKISAKEAWGVVCIVIAILGIPASIYNKTEANFQELLIGCLGIAVIGVVLIFLGRKDRQKYNANNGSWTKWNNVHNTYAQKKRMRRAQDGHLTCTSIDVQRGAAVFQSNEPGREPYTTSVSSCSCPDFAERALPCKHMYYLASKMGLINFDSYLTDDEEIENDQIPNLSHLEPSKPAGTPGRFLNYSIYKVKGTDESGKRKSVIKTGVDEQQAIEKAARQGISPPFSVEILPYDPPTERQIECLKSHGTYIPDEITKDDASSMINRIVEDDLESPAIWLFSLAIGLKTNFSAFIGKQDLYENVIYQTNDRDRAALYAYAVQQRIKDESFENMLQDPNLDLFYRFADQAVQDPAIINSLKGREADDFLYPRKGTAIYKAAEAFLANSGLTTTK